MNFRIYILGIVTLVAFSCSDFLKERSQDLAYVHSYEDLDELLIGSAYLNPDNDSYFPYLHLMADETTEVLTNPDASEDDSDSREVFFGFYTWQKRVELKPDGTENKSDAEDWSRIYEHINLVNMILFEADQMGSSNEAERLELLRIRGEAYFLRAAYYFWLVNIYGKPYQEKSSATDLGVPIKTTEYIEDKLFVRNTVKEVYRQVLDDLEKAEEHLKDIPRKSLYRADIVAVYLLKSRVALYMQDWTTAKTYARKVLDKNSSLVDMNTWKIDQGSFVTKTSPETIFSMGANKLTGLVSFRVKGFGVSEELLNLYDEESGDLRPGIFFSDEYTVPACVKYTSLSEFLVNVSENFVFRTPEAYLNLAESCAYLNDETGARKALDHLREYRFDRTLGYEPVDKTGKDLVEEIRQERCRELCFEGHRWFDMRRYSVHEKYPLTKVLRNTYSTFGYNDEYDMVPLQTLVYELKPGDPAYTLPIPKAIRNYDGMENNERNERSASEVINY